MKSSSPRSHFGANLLRMQDEDRRRIARELHSTTSQRLAALQLNLALVERSADHLEARARAALADSIDLVRTCAREIRSVSYRLHPPLLDEFGLSAALRAFIEEYTQRTGIGVAMDMPPAGERLPREIEIGIFRIVQECVANLHPETPVRLRLWCDGGNVRLEMTCAVLPKTQCDSVALAAMHERALQLSGRLVIRSDRSGLTVRLKIPVPRH